MSESPISPFYISAIAAFFLSFILMPVFFGILRQLGLYVTVQERFCRVYVLFGKVVGILGEPGLHFLPARLGLKAFPFCTRESGPPTPGGEGRFPNTPCAGIGIFDKRGSERTIKCPERSNNNSM